MHESEGAVTIKKSRSKKNGPVSLTSDQKALASAVQEKLDAALNKLMVLHRPLDAGELDSLGEDAAKLHASLKAGGITVRHHKYMVENRGLSPDAPSFYKHIHPVQDLLKFLQNQSANDDPVDQTLGHEFSVQIFSRRWNHTDNYRFVRTPTGWTIKQSHNVDVGRDGLVGGKPGTGLFDFLDHDSINYPEELPGYLEWLWERAAEDGLSAAKVQAALKQLATWVNTLEKSSPKGIFRGYK